MTRRTSSPYRCTWDFATACKEFLFKRDIAVAETPGGEAKCGRPTCLEVAVAVAKSSPQVSERFRDVGVGHGQDAFSDRDGARITSGHLFAGDEQYSNNPAVVGEKPKRAPRRHGYCRTIVAQRRARSRRQPCCKVEISASVDSVPWLRFGPSAVSPS